MAFVISLKLSMKISENRPNNSFTTAISAMPKLKCLIRNCNTKELHTNQSGSYKSDDDVDHERERERERARKQKIECERETTTTKKQVERDPPFKKPMCVRYKSSKVKDNLKFKQFI